MNWFGSAFQSLVWDGNSDASNNPNSGSMKITADFNGLGSIPNQFTIFDGFKGINPPLTGLQYTNFQCDIRFADGSAIVSANGTSIFGHLQFGVSTAGGGQDYFGAVDVSAGNYNWVHVSLPLDAAADTNLLNISDVLIHIYGSYYSPGLTGASVLWVDNVQFTGGGVPPINCVVNWNNVHQRIDGFGASSAWDGSWTAAQADMFFSTNIGIGLSFLRSRIAPDGTTVETNIMQMAQARGARVWSTPWSPPAIYKNTNSVNGGSFVSSVANYRGYANQLAGYVASMKNHCGVNLYALSMQNEPDMHTDYESCLWTGQQFHDFIPYLSAALTNAGAGSIQILFPEDANWNYDLSSFVTTTMNDPNTFAQVGILAAHDYGGLNVALDNYGKPLWETETSTFDPFDGSISNAVNWAVEIHDALTIAQVNAWHYWWLIPAGTDNEGLTDSSGNPAKRMYVLGNYSRFIRPNYYRIDVNNNNVNSLVSAYKDPISGKFAIVAINTNLINLPQTFNFTNVTPADVTPWITSANTSLASNATLAVANGSLTYNLPPMSVVTFVGQDGNQPPTLVPVLNQYINPGINLTITNTAIEPNVPAAALTFSLMVGPPNASINQVNSTNAVVVWRPRLSQANTTNELQIVVSDSSSPRLSATNVFNVIVYPLTASGFSSISYSSQQVSLVFTGAYGPDYQIWLSTNLVNWQLLSTALSPPLPFTFIDTNSWTRPVSYYHCQLGPQ
jgi:glucuronoarabinoxylan endo-1,4-beta-xylanase